MVDFDRGIWRVLLRTRTDVEARRLSVVVGYAVLLVSFALVFASGFAHFFGLTLLSIMVFAWLGGWRSGLLAGLAVPLFSIPVGLIMGVPLIVLTVDVSTFAFMAILCASAVGLISSLFGQVVDTRKELNLLYQILPICSHCHKIKQEDKEWVRLESFFDEHAGTQFSHGICPSCLQEHYAADMGE